MSTPAPHNPSTDHWHDHAHHGPQNGTKKQKKQPLIQLTERGNAVWEKVKKYKKIAGALLFVWGGIGAGYGLADHDKEPVSIGNIKKIAAEANTNDTLIGGAFQHLWQRLADQVDEYDTFVPIEGTSTHTSVRYMVKIAEKGDKKSITFKAIRDFAPTATEKSAGERNIHEVTFSQYGENDDTVTRFDSPSGEVSTDKPHISRVHNLTEFLAQMQDIRYIK